MSGSARDEKAERVERKDAFLVVQHQGKNCSDNDNDDERKRRKKEKDYAKENPPVHDDFGALVACLWRIAEAAVAAGEGRRVVVEKEGEMFVVEIERRDWGMVKRPEVPPLERQLLE